MTRRRNRLAVPVAVSALAAALILAAVWSSGSWFASGQAKRTPARKTSPVAGRVRSVASSVQTARNLGAAYYEQGKYAEAAGQFKKVIASGHALALDHMDLGLAMMQNNKLDEALGEMTTAQQMAPQSVAVQYNLGILYKRELRYPDAEAALKKVVAADPGEPSGWFNLGTIYFAERKFPEALDAHEHVNKMGFGRAQNFYVASLFRTFTVLLRLGRQDDAQKILKVHERMRDRVPSISLQNQALEGGKYGAVQLPAVTPSIPVSAPARVTFEDITASAGLSLPELGGSRRESADGIRAADYSLDFARKNLVPIFGPSVALGDYDGDGHTDVYVVNPAGSNHLFHNNGDGTFTDVTD
ncbi:MAG TPA: tetratricopeptide repeat protein, partial [Terriglobia bacterium]|nr:tetratricopeptide repeat protein [Terriglobia bacterium]